MVDRTVDLVDEGFDIAVRIGVLAESSAVATRVGAVRRIVVASPDYLARRGTPQVPADLEAHAVVAFSGIAGVEHWLFRAATGEASIAIQPRLVVTTAEAAMDAARTGVGLTRVLSYQAADDVARGSLLRVLPGYEGDDVPIHLVYPGDGIRRRSCARSWISPRPGCAAAAPLWSERSIPDCVELFRTPAGDPNAQRNGDAGFLSTGFKSKHQRLRGVTDPPRPESASRRKPTCLPRRRAPSCFSP